MLRIEQKFNVDKTELMSRFVKLQSIYHPDNSVASRQKSLDITDAYETIKDEIKRGEAILDIHGININEIRIPQEFLAEIIDIDLNKAKTLFNNTLKKINDMGIINKNNADAFAQEFLQLKYLKAKLMHGK